MAKTSSGFRAALLVGWTALCGIGILYARLRGIPGWAAWPALAAILVEYPFYLVAGFPPVRERLSGAHWRLPAFAVAFAVLPYLICCAGAVHFQPVSVVRLAAVALVLSLWYRLFAPHPVADLGFLAVVAGFKIGQFLQTVYPAPLKGVDIGILGDVALMQITVLSLMVARRVVETGYGFWPTAKDWRIGSLHFLYFIPIGFPLAVGIKALHLVKPAAPWKVIGVAAGFLFVLALFEEFLFRGVLQQWFEDWTRNRRAALILTSVLFGGVHLWFRTFPNWRWALVAGAMGWFCGRARNQAASIRAAVVTHALVAAAWRAFFAS